MEFFTFEELCHLLRYGLQSRICYSNCYTPCSFNYLAHKINSTKLILKLLHLGFHHDLSFVRMYISCYSVQGGPGSSVIIATGYGLNGPGMETRCGRDFPHLSRSALGPIQPPVQWILGFSLSKERSGRDADPSPTSIAVGHERVELYLYSPYGPYGLYRASVRVQGCTLPFYSVQENKEKVKLSVSIPCGHRGGVEAYLH